MLLYIPDWVMFYSVDSFRYDKSLKEAYFVICHWRFEIIIKNVDVSFWYKIRRSVLHDLYFEVCKDYDWDIRLLR